jgi:DNA-binding GntR family transcriptional regulator
MNGPSLRKIEREPLWDLAHAQLRDGLLAGRFAPGSKLTLRYLAETFGTSITPVRDAITRLAAQGVLQFGPRHCAVVPEITVGELRELTTIRCELEGRAAFEAATRRDAEALSRLEEQLVTMKGFIAARKLTAYLSMHRKFHFGIYAAAHMPILGELVENLWLRCGPTLGFVVPEYVLLLKGTDHHTSALEAMQRRDGRRAEKAIVADIQDASAYLETLAGADGIIRAPGTARKQRA